jgi:hypothetical protein
MPPLMRALSLEAKTAASQAMEAAVRETAPPAAELREKKEVKEEERRL